jgi:histidine triad (HIT) family protein
MDECIFCKIARGEIPCKKVYEDSSNMAFLDINPRNPGHTLVIPKNHSQDILSISEKDATALMKAITRVAKGVVKVTGAKGINLTQNNGQLAGQIVPHIHFHIIPRTPAEKGAALESVLPVKQQDEATLDSMARKISSAIPKATTEPKEPKPEPAPTLKGASEPEPKEDKPVTSGTGKKESKDESLSDPDKQKIDFDF